MQQHVYIVISQTGTLLSRIIKLVTKAEYNHASISFAPDLGVMYSFGRKHPYNPFWGGFVRESPHWGTFKRFSKTRVIVLDVAVTEEQYRQMRSRIDAISANRKYYHYNYFGLYLAALHIPFHQKRCFYCSEFVNHLLVQGNVRGAKNVRSIVQPMHFLSLPAAKQIYCGNLIDYNRIASAACCRSPAFR